MEFREHYDGGDRPADEFVIVLRDKSWGYRVRRSTRQ